MEEEKKVEANKSEAAPEQDDFKKRLEAMLSKGRPPAQTTPAPQKASDWGSKESNTRQTGNEVSDAKFEDMPKFKLQRAASNKFNVDNFDF